MAVRPSVTVARHSSMDCINHDEASIASFRTGMELCFRRAVEEGLSLSIVPHLDDGGSTAAWRNGILFNPKTKKGGYSYQQVMLNPIVDAMAAALAARPKWVQPLQVWLALQGEMSATVLRYPREYKQLSTLAVVWGVAAQPASLRKGASHATTHGAFPAATQGTGGGSATASVPPGSENVNTGGGLGGGSAASVIAGNGGVLSGFRGFGPFLGGALRGRGLLAEGVPAVDTKALGELFEAIDFLGISAYAALDDPDFPASALQNSAYTFFGVSAQAGWWMRGGRRSGAQVQEMRKEVGFDAAAVIERRGIDLHYSEFGMGGGSSPTGTAAARDPAAAARTPFYGVWGAYNGATDPWAPPEMRDFLHSFFRKTLGWLAVGGGPTYKISHCFLWGMGSWDVLGIYRESTTKAGSFRDPKVAEAVKRHNNQVVAVREAASKSK
ncbi:hypothetical protein TSOC_006094 [Tetrabaena socialis]|uniref:Uncharacterized protein n=1 Tax=Tetrabaena socialis TaxID=47790 RepID=A0A2J8A4K5_9CHLO|nr:hypothetical protein TSOC_006094 [Tetrabaena socialis]|eukprot:PNH07449.1 hypothetical protein TSOC_006094 [Tetrabaena socialis]